MIELSRLSFRDIAKEVWLDLKARPGRSSLTALGTMVGIAVLVSTLGLAASLDAQIAARFDALSATEIAAKSALPEHYSAIPVDAVDRVLRIHGTVAAATLSEITTATRVTGTPGYDPTAAASSDITVFASSPAMVDIAQGVMRGVYFNSWHDATKQPVVVLGRGAAERLRIADVSGRPVVFINGQPVTVTGILDAAPRHSILLQAAIVPQGYAESKLGLVGAATLLVETEVGAAEVVADQVGLAIRPDQPDIIRADAPPSPELTRQQVADDTQNLLLALGAISLIIGGIGIANMTLVSVLERTPEIGLRRAIGARRRHIISQFLLSSVATAIIGALAGDSVGMIVTATVATIQQWPPTMPTLVPILGPLVGAVIGLLAGLYPALQAGRIEPIDTLRSNG
ncbi:ABC transporter permease [Micropruina sp.]|uniref:ABC transporter permease n=1 Tax=Micropruina sp. TaxID=2737536 RepID=UPI0039E46994